jgi:hypothetical protein
MPSTANMNRLTAEMYEEIVACLRSDETKRGSEKRKRPRVGLRSSVEVHPCPARGRMQAGIVVWVRDVSAEGLGLVSPVSLAVGLEFVVEFARFDSEQLRVKYRVAYRKMISQGLYNVGARLVSVLGQNSVSRERKAG